MMPTGEYSIPIKKKGDRYRRVWAVVKEIPSGCVATDGQIAALCGHPRHARLVGYALHALPQDAIIPWHRVINSRGQISLPAHSAEYQQQRQRLLGEGIEFHGNTVDLKLFGWSTSPDELLWG